MAPQSLFTLTGQWDPAVAGDYNIFIEIDPLSKFSENNLSNNSLYKSLTILPYIPMDRYFNNFNIDLKRIIKLDKNENSYFFDMHVLGYDEKSTLTIGIYDVSGKLIKSIIENETITVDDHKYFLK